MTTPTDDLLWQQLKGVPAFRALLRAVESRFYQDLDLARPVLDLGCGDGHFASTTFATPPEVGVDPWWGPLEKARGRDVYSLPVQAAGDHLPFADGQFGAVISNSVLEHIPDVDAVLQETARVLQAPEFAGGVETRPGGLLVITMPSENFTRFLSISSALRRIGLDRAAAAYESWFNHISRHHHCDSPAVWHERLAAVGLSTVRWQYYFSPRAHHRLEWGHFLGLPSLVSKLLLGRWVIAPWRSSLQWTERWLRPSYDEPPPEQGAYLFFIAQRATPDQEFAPIPPPSPVDAVAPEPVTLPHVQETPAPAGIVKESSHPQSIPPPQPAPGASVKSLAWLAAALILAIVGQMSWNWRSRPYEPGDGLTWYGLALLSLAIYIWQSAPRRLLGRPRRKITLDRTFERLRGQSARLILLLLGFLLSLFARLSVGDAVRPAGGATSALLFWVAGIGLVILALWPGALAGLARWSRRAREKGLAVPTLSLPRHRLAWGSWGRWEILALFAIVLVAFLIRFADLDEIPHVLAGDEASMGRQAAEVLSGELGNPFITGWFSHPTLFYYVLALPVKLLGQNTFAVRFLSPFIGALAVLGTYLFARRAWGRTVALAAAILLTGYHFHIHYSRLALNNIWDPLFALLVLGLLWQGWQTGDRRYYIAGGLGLGISQYFYTGARLLLLLAAVLVLYWILVDRQRVWEQRSNLVTALLVVLVVSLPIALFSIKHPDDYMARMNQLGIFHSGWLRREVEISGRSAGSLLWEQLWKSALAFNYTLDPTPWYQSGIPLLRFWPSIFFVFGLGLALVGIKKTPNFILLLWITATVIFAGAILENPPSSQRYVIAAPAVCILVALPLAWGGEQLRRLLGGRKEAWLAAVLSLVLFFSWGDIRFYFGDYTLNGDYGGLNTEVAQRSSDYLLDLDPDWQVFFFGFPRMGISSQGGFPSVSFLVPEADSVDVIDTLTDPSELPNLQLPATFIFLPERFAEMNVIRDAFPNGTEKRFPGRFNRILFVAYEVTN